MYKIQLALIVFVSAPAGWSVCDPAPEIRSEILKADAARVDDLMDFDRNVAPFGALRDRHMEDRFVHERYQDAVQQHGIEGHLKALTLEYSVLATQHYGDPMYRYLYARTLIGRSTRAAIRTITEILAEHPDFASAHRALAEIFGSEAFRDMEAEKSARERFLALCPGSAIGPRPGVLPDRSPLLDEAARLLDQNGDPARILEMATAAMEMATAAIRHDEWRLQRIRAFDWYSEDSKRQSLRELRLSYWTMWSIQVRCYRKSGQPGKAAQLLAMMDQQAAAMDASQRSEYSNALSVLAQLHAEEP